MKTGRYVWAVEPAPEWFDKARARWMQHALRSRVPFTRTDGASIWRRIREPALCGAVPPDGVWSSVGNGWDPPGTRRLLARLRVDGDGDTGVYGCAPPCQECERLASEQGLDHAREAW